MSTIETRHSGANDTGMPLANDLMVTVKPIAEFMFGDDSEANRRKVYHAADKLGLPLFKMGGSLCGRRSTILKWIEAQESAA